jgi:hypothetical protein
MASCIHTCTAANFPFLLVKWVPKYVNSVTTSTLYSARLILCAACLFFFAWIRTFVCDSFIYLRPTFFPSVFRSLKASFAALKVLPIRFMSSAYPTICTNLYWQHASCFNTQLSNDMF